MAAVQAAPLPRASGSIVGRLYKERAEDAIEERDDAIDERDDAMDERDMAVDERDMAVEEVERLEALVAELKEEMKNHKKKHRCQLTKAEMKKTVAGGRGRRTGLKRVNYRV